MKNINVYITFLKFLQCVCIEIYNVQNVGNKYSH